MTDVAVYGPPWRVVLDSRAVLFADPPRGLGCAAHEAVAVFSPSLGELVRLHDPGRAESVALELSRRGDGSAVILKGAIQTGSGRWLWPIVVDRVAVGKAGQGPLSRRGFALAVERLHNALMGTSGRAERRMIRDSLRQLARPWPDMTAEELDAAVEGIAEMIGEIPDDVAFRLASTGVVEAAALRVAGASRLVAGAGVGTTLRAGARDIARSIGRNSLTFVTNEYRTRGASWSATARSIIARDVDRGLGRVAIGRDLHQALRSSVSGRSEWYYRVVASSATSQARSYGSLTGYRDAGIVYYMWEAFLDDRCCDICRFLHGQIFPVGETISRVENAARNPDPEAGVNENPWYRIVGGETGPDGLRRGGDIYVSPRGQGPTVLVASVRESAVGTNDRRGTFDTRTEVRAAGGCLAPPAHGMCRCTTIPA